MSMLSIHEEWERSQNAGNKNKKKVLIKKQSFIRNH